MDGVQRGLLETSTPFHRFGGRRAQEPIGTLISVKVVGVVLGEMLS